MSDVDTISVNGHITILLCSTHESKFSKNSTTQTYRISCLRSVILEFYHTIPSFKTVYSKFPVIRGRINRGPPDLHEN
jgi:hypothetical protein